MARECPKCYADLPRRAKYCPRCGQDVAAVTDLPAVLTAHPRARRELAVGWILLATGGGLLLFGLLSELGARSWLCIGFGIPLLVIGIGTLVGNEANRGEDADKPPLRSVGKKPAATSDRQQA